MNDPNAYPGERADERIERLSEELGDSQYEFARVQGERDRLATDLFDVLVHRLGCEKPEALRHVLQMLRYGVMPCKRPDLAKLLSDHDLSFVKD